MIKLDQFIHTPGVHCSSTCIQDLVRFDGIEISECMAFGLGGGLGFVFYHGDALSPASRFNGRAAGLEEKFYQRIGQPIEWQGKWDLPAIKKALENNRPVLAKSFLAHLPYYEPADFPGHGIVVTALNEENNRITVADSISKELQTISIDNFHQAIATDCAPLMRPYSWAIPPRADFKIEAQMLRQAIVDMAQTMLNPNSDLEGIAAMEAAIKEIPHWLGEADWQWHARFAYQSIEKRGTGGGGFRLLYASFLKEAAHFLPELLPLKLDESLQQSAKQWQSMAQAFKSTFIENDRNGFIKAAERLAQIKQLESDFCYIITEKLK